MYERGGIVTMQRSECIKTLRLSQKEDLQEGVLVDMEHLFQQNVLV